GAKPVSDPAAAHDSGYHRGETVRLKGGTQIGELDTDPDEKGNVIVVFGNIRMRSHIDDIETVGRKEIKREQAGRTTVVNVNEAETRLDLRGRYGDEAVVDLEQAITAALNSHIGSLDVIHGKGTGALRRRIHDYLTAHPSVASFRLGSLTEGGAGVTIVELK
ncbi:MAG: Smr/MutS family protein, partial [bacterium]|nr:Smr/MutS family protein [Candidatus Kapabacteria bacterium]